jgi:hypothetical protein
VQSPLLPPPPPPPLSPPLPPLLLLLLLLLLLRLLQLLRLRLLLLVPLPVSVPLPVLVLVHMSALVPLFLFQVGSFCPPCLATNAAFKPNLGLHLLLPTLLRVRSFRQNLSFTCTMLLPWCQAPALLWNGRLRITKCRVAARNISIGNSAFAFALHSF